MNNNSLLVFLTSPKDNQTFMRNPKLFKSIFSFHEMKEKYTGENKNKSLINNILHNYLNQSVFIFLFLAFLELKNSL